MVEQEWGGLEATFTTSLRETKVEPVPGPIVKLAQRSLEGAPHPEYPNDPDKKIHAMQLEFESAEKAEAFAKHMRNAGPHTKPPSSITVVVDPQSVKVEKVNEAGNVVRNDAGKPIMVPGAPVNPKVVAFRAGVRRGRKT
jgi:hypothetical protein